MIRSFTPTQLDFNGQVPNTSSAAQTLTLHNNQGVTLNVTSSAITGANAASYIKGTDTCSASAIPSGGTCTVQVSFAPSAIGGFPASLTFTDNAPGSAPDYFGWNIARSAALFSDGMGGYVLDGR